MSIPILNDLYHEIRRLAVAGSVVAPGDFRLQKLIDPLRKSGEKAPVFLRVADAAQRVIDANESTSAAPLLELSSLVSSILYTQGRTGLEGEIDDLPPSTMTLQTTLTSARVLKPLLEALTTSGSGRFEQIKTAFEMNLFHDLRLVRPTLLALDDSYSEIRDFVANKVLPTYGRAILGDLISTFDVGGKGGHAHRLKLIHRIAPERARPLVMQGLEAGSKEIKLAAIECLGDVEDDLGYLIEQTRARSKDVRAAALISLGRMKSPEATRLLIHTLDSRDIGLLHRAAEETAPLEVIAQAWTKSNEALTDLLELKDRSQEKQAVQRLLDLLPIATSQLDKAKEQGLLKWIDQSERLEAIKSDPSGADVIGYIVQRLSQGSAEAARSLVERREQIPETLWSAIVPSAHRHLTPAEFFQTFSPYVHPVGGKSGKSRQSKQVASGLRSDSIVDLILQSRNPYFQDRETSSSVSPPLSTEWLGFAIEADHPQIVFALVDLPHPRLHDYLLEKWNEAQAKKQREGDWVIGWGLVRSGHPDATQIVLDQVRTSIARKQSTYDGHAWARMCGHLAPSAIPELETIIALPGASAAIGHVLLEAIDTIRENSANDTRATSG